LQPSTLAKRGYLLLFLATLVFYFYGLGRLPLLGADEPRYAEVAREMLERRDLITPTLAGHPWFEKPVLLYWMMMANFHLFGISEWTARLSSAISGLLTVAAVYWLAKRVEAAAADASLSGFACASALITASSAGILGFSRGTSFDIALTMTITWALAFFLVSELETNDRQRQLLLAGFYFFVGLSLLAKGLVGIVIPFSIIGVYFMVRREFPGTGRFLSLIWGLPLAFGVAAIWYGPVLDRHGWPFIDNFFIQHHFARYVTGKYHHPQRLYFYVLVLIPLTLPWTAFLVDGLIRGRSWLRRSNPVEQKVRVFALVWLIVPIVFFSFSQSKLPGYILPVLPGAALIVGERLIRFASGQEKGTWVIRATGVVLLIFVMYGVIYAKRSGIVSVRCMMAIGAPLLLAGLGSIFWARISKYFLAVMASATLAALLIALNCDLTRISQRESARDLIDLANSRGYASAPLYSLHDIDRTAEFYAAGRLAYGPDGEPLKFEGAAQVLAAARASGGPILVLVPKEAMQQVTDLKNVQTEVIGVNRRSAIIAVRAW